MKIIILLLCLARFIFCNQMRMGYELEPKYGTSSADDDTVLIGTNANENFSNGLTVCLRLNFHYLNSARIFSSDSVKLDLEDHRYRKKKELKIIFF
jgi:hypothetical protein